MLEIREEIDGILANGVYEWRNEHPLIRRETIDQILSIKLGNHTLGELIEMIDNGELVKKAKDQRLPPNPNMEERVAKEKSLRQDIEADLPEVEYWQAQQDILNKGFRRVEPLR